VTARAPRRWQEARIARIAPLTPRIVQVELEAPIPAHRAGQHLDVRLTAPDGYQAQRSYSICSAPGAPRVALAIERLEDGEVSPYFHEVAEPGDTFEVRGPIGGHFVWREQDGGPLLLVAGGSGIAPLVAIARHRAATARGLPTLLVYSARTWDDLAFRDELIAMEADDPAFRIAITTTRGPKVREQDHERRLDRALTAELLAGWGGTPRHVYVCGSNGFVEAATAGLLALGVPPSHIRTERFGEAGT
jgi:ferredoxin-NADP reductase